MKGGDRSIPGLFAVLLESAWINILVDFYSTGGPHRRSIFRSYVEVLWNN